ncbi:unnamed protein product [Rotaria sp. Silwood1]|nr:unnamed protein product [Rotaria sp. Silwood1]CAF3326890.1 unnamed protein product [Rotaria sp. Silwood1]CAF3344668.1 unnamed protein product [Rotaria sp. Silwood1]CAF4500362.1 unnamed protein product [Rotaria sp. Silwood1]CAF4603620.1 unnamed protein product [Rotaria sp. Silwood1]
MELRHCSRLAVSLVRLSRQPKLCYATRNFSSSSRLLPMNSSQLILKRSLSWQFWKSSTPATIDPWPANIAHPTSESITVASSTSILTVPDVPKIEADEFGYIPEPPTVPSDIPIEFLLNAAGEPALSTLGLGKWYLPTGWVQQGLDLIHANIGLPWWATIMLGTLIIRTMTTPIAIYNQRSAAQMQIHMPKLQELQAKLQEARIRNDQLAIMRAGSDLMEFMKYSDIKPWKAMLGPFMQMPFFISLFLGIRGLANYPLESMMYGGVLWFPDLTVADPYYILPVFTAFTMFITMELGIETGMRTANLGPIGRNALRVIPFLSLFFTVHFSSALTLYWATSNVISLVQSVVLRQPSIRKALRLPAPPPKRIDTKIKKKKGLAGLRENYRNSKLLAEVEKRKQLGDDIFRRAGISSAVPTYKYDPTKVKENNPPQIRKVSE